MSEEKQELVGQRAEHGDLSNLSPQEILAAARIALLDPEYERFMDELRLVAHKKIVEQTSTGQDNQEA